MRLNQETLNAIALAIRPYITPYIERCGQLSQEAIRKLAKEHTPYSIRSVRSCTIVENLIVEM